MLKNPRFSYYPRVVLNKGSILVKNSLFKKPKIVFWNDLKSIKLKSYKFDFISKSGETNEISLDAFANESIEFKKALRFFGAELCVEVGK